MKRTVAAVVASFAALVALAAPAGAQAADAEPADGGAAQAPPSGPTATTPAEGGALGEGEPELVVELDQPEGGGDADTGDAVCSGSNRTISGTVHGTDGERVNAFVGLALQNAFGQGIPSPAGASYYDTDHLNAGLPLEGGAGGPTSFTFTGIPNGACTFWLEVYPKEPNTGITNRTYYGGGLVRSRALTATGSQGNDVYLPMTCGIGGGTPADVNGTTTGTITVRTFVNWAPRASDRVSYWANYQNPNNYAYGFGVESPPQPYPSEVLVRSVAADNRYDVRVQILSTGSSRLAEIIPNVPVYPCQDTSLLVNFTAFGVQSTTWRFRDVPPSSPFYDDIEWMALSDITTGYSNATYRPADVVTRQAMAAFMYRLRGEPPFTAPGTPSFTDVPTTSPFYDEVEWLAAEGISTGYANGTFRPFGHVTREAMSAFMYRLAEEPPFDDPVAPTFADVPLDHHFFHEIEWMADTGVTEGYGDGTYRPGTGVTRQAMSAFMHRLDALLA